jgi:predicted RNA methylase
MLYERHLPIDTGRVIQLEELGVAHPDRVRYQPSPWRNLGCILDPRDVQASDVFLDLGSGMGRVLLQAARYPFGRVIGVEISEELNRIARRAIEASPDLGCRDIELVTADVLDYEIPTSVSVVYMFNPFRGAIFEGAVRRVIESFDRRPRRVRLIYANPLEHEALEATGRVRLARSVRAGNVLMYELVAG